ncbi:hypothetical protein, partial [Deinococcus xinjiangensis]|uniref:hypothetical protein n=1 Tax=Deinococcus xinjiangensis TaxID=457454 RepID=UPI0033655AB9
MKELSVAAALENVYAAFASVPRPKKIEGCPCCTTPERLAALTAGPLRSLDEELLSWYGFKSMTTIGDEQDYLYFIPRLLESLDWGFSSPDPEMTFSQELHLHNGRKALPAERIWECQSHRFRGSVSAFWQMSSWRSPP